MQWRRSMWLSHFFKTKYVLNKFICILFNAVIKMKRWKSHCLRDILNSIYVPLYSLNRDVLYGS